MNGRLLDHAAGIVAAGDGDEERGELDVIAREVSSEVGIELEYEGAPTSGAVSPTSRPTTTSSSSGRRCTRGCWILAPGTR